MPETNQASPRWARLSRSSLSTEIYEEVRRTIVEGRLLPGDALVESVLASEFGVSRAPVREALGRLKAEGLVVDSDRRGIHVRELTLEDIVDIYNVRFGIERVAIVLCARRQVDATGLRRIIDEMETAAGNGDVQQLTHWDFRFHEEVCELSGNRQLAETFAAISAQLRIAFALDNRITVEVRDLQELAALHTPLVDAIGAGEEANADLTLRAHIGESIDFVIRELAQRSEEGDTSDPEYLATLRKRFVF